MKQAVKSALGLGNASTATIAPVGAPLATSGLSAYGPTVATIPVAQTVTVPTVVDTVETIQQPILKETTTVQKQVIPAIVEHREVAPVVHQRIRQEEVEEIQPVIHREREKTEIHKIVQPLYTTATMGIAAEERTLAAQVRPEIRISGPLPPASILPTTQYESAQKVRVDKAPIIMETERKRIIEEVQPVLYKEVIQPHVIRITQPIYEKIVEADVYIDRVLPATTLAAPIVQQVAPVTTFTPIVQQASIASTSTMNVAEPTSAFTQTFDITTPVNAPGISANRIEGVSQGVQVAPLPVSVQPLASQSLGIQQPISSFSSTSFQTLPQQQFLGAQSSLLGSQGGLAQPGFATGFEAQQPLAMQQFPQSSLGMQPGFSQSSYMQPGFQQSSFAQPGFQQGLAQSSYAQPGFSQSSYMQPGFQQSSFAQPGFQQGLAQSSYAQPGFSQSSYMQPGFQQGLGQSSFAQPGFQQSSFAQPGLQQGLGQSSFAQPGLGQSNMGLGQSNLGLGQSNLGMQQGGLTQGLTTGLGQSMGQQLGSSLGGMSKGLGGMGSSLGSSLGSALGSATTAF